MNSKPKISVVIVTYNSAKYLREAIDSVLSQTLPPFEVIICDDHSTDGSWEIIMEYSQRYPSLIRAYRHKQNLGIPRNLNSSFEKIRGDWVTFHAGDDRFRPRKLELEWEALQRYPGAQVVYSNVYTIDKDGNRIGIFHNNRIVPPPTGDSFVQVFSRVFFSNTSSLFRNELISCSAFRDIGGYDENLESFEDWDYKIRLSARYPLIYTGEALVEYRLHSGGFSASDPEKHLRAMIQVYEKNLSLLTNRSQTETTRVKCHIESMLALRPAKLPSSKHASYYSARSVYNRNRVLLDHLSKHDCMVLEKELTPIFTQLVGQVAREEIEKGDRKAAAKYWLESLRQNPKSFDFGLAAQLILPQCGYRWLKDAYRVFRDVRR